MSLLRDIQNAAIDANVDIVVLLRKCKVLAARLGNPDFKKWVEYELNGYLSKDALPPYRILSVHSRGHFSGPFGSGFRAVAIPPGCLPKEWRDMATKAYLTDGISSYNALLLHDTDQGELLSHWNPDLLPHVEVYQDMSCYAAWREIPRNSIVNMIDTVRNRILSFVLEIESAAPDAGEAALNSDPLPQEKVTRVFNTNIYGDVQNVAAGSTNVRQSGDLNIQAHDLDSLAKYLKSQGIADEDIGSLKEAVQHDKKENPAEDQIGSGVASWIAEMLNKAAKGSLKTGKSIVASVLTKAICSYYGI